jgi:dTDP-4-dehydrorhamnose 3,5-epimerase
MKFNKLHLDGAFTIDLEPRIDDRGFFSRLFCQKEFSLHGLESNWKQINNSFSKNKFTLRGLHYQSEPMSEVKLIRCVKGAIWDVIVDLRKDSETFSEWFATELSENNRRMMYVPKGFAHGFLSLTENSEILYLVSEFYSSDHELTLRWDDPLHKIKWPESPSIISEKDMNAQYWKI